MSDTDTRPVLKVHTIAQWFALDEPTRNLILQHIKLKDRLQRYLYDLNVKDQKQPLTEPRWVPCKHCDKRGWIELQPRYPGIHPSQLPNACLLRIFKEMCGEEKKEKIEPRQRMIFDLGTAAHRLLQSAGQGDPGEDGFMDAAGKLMLTGYGVNGAWGPHYRPEVPVDGEHQKLSAELMIEGHVDAENILVIDDIPGFPYIVEIGLVHEYKTINANGFEKLTKPLPKHKTQALIYSVVLDRPIVVYLYLNKNDSNLADFPVPFDAKLWAPLEAKARTLKWSYDNKTPPPASCGYHCRECPYVFDCADYKAFAASMAKLAK